MRHTRSLLVLAGVLLAGCGVPDPGGDTITQADAGAVLPTSTPIASAAPSPTAELAAKSVTEIPATPTPIPPTATIVPPVAPTVAPTRVPPTATTVPATQGTITITAPTDGAAIISPVTVKGSTNFWPFEATLVGQIKDAQGNVLGVGPITVESPGIGQGGPFEAQIAFDAPATDQIGTLEVFEVSAADGSIVVIEKIAIQLRANP